MLCVLRNIIIAKYVNMEFDFSITRCDNSQKTCPNFPDERHLDHTTGVCYQNPSRQLPDDVCFFSSAPLY